jgi:hypothetical protein
VGERATKMIDGPVIGYLKASIELIKDICSLFILGTFLRFPCKNCLIRPCCSEACGKQKRFARIFRSYLYTGGHTELHKRSYYGVKALIYYFDFLVIFLTAEAIFNFI